MFQIHDTVICPGHGLGKIDRLESRELSGTNKNFFVIKLQNNNMKVMMPEGQEGLRSLASKKEVEEVLKKLQNHDVKIDIETWNKRHQKFHALLRTGKLLDVAEIYHQLMLSKNFKQLSFGERKMLDHAQNLLSLELALIQEKCQWIVKEELENIYKGNK